jgi:hypothetical protein
VRKCYFAVSAFADMDYEFIAAARKHDAATGDKWREEILKSFNDHNNGQSYYAPGDDDGGGGTLFIVCESLKELQVCLAAMKDVGSIPYAIHAANLGCESEATAKVTFTLSHGPYAQIDLPDSAPWLPGLIEARRVIGKMIEDNGGRA